MVSIESTRDFATQTYQRMAETLGTVRQRLNRPLSLAEKVLLSHLDDPENQEIVPGETYIRVRPDRVILQDVLGQTAMLQFMQTLRDKVAVPTTIHCDHLIQARHDGVQDLRESLAENDEVYGFLRSAAARYGVGFWEPGAGIIHQVNLENYAFPGQLIIGTDSHTPNAGGLGACSVGVGGADAVEVMAGLPWDVLMPKRIGVVLTGEMSGWTAPKDVILKLAGLLTVSGGTNHIIEYLGPGARSFSCTGKATITNMGAELGATTSMFPYDQSMADYLDATSRPELAELADRYSDMLQADPEVEADPDRYFDQVVRIDLSTLEPHVVGPHSPDRARPISEMAAEVADPANEFIDDISAALIGSCTNSSYEDMSRAADVAEQAAGHGLKSAVPFMVTPGSEQVRATIERDGQMDSLLQDRRDGARQRLRAVHRTVAPGKRDATTEANTIVTSYNRNFPRRNDGQPATMNFIASPEIITAYAIAGSLSFNPLTGELTGADGTPFRLNPPGVAPEVPEEAFDPGVTNYVAPPEDGSGVSVEVSPTSERLQIMEPWSAWDGDDFERAPVLLKVSGKCTTDHISPAGPWLSLRGHLDRFSDNMFMGAVNAHTGESGKTKNLRTGEEGVAVSRVARSYKADGVRWVVVGDDNYGEGSSREHAALSPRLLNGAAVISRSFARIHETNLKKQGLLALTFSDRADYDRIQEDDHISIVGLSSLAPGKPVKAILHHADGTDEELRLNHSFAEEQIRWFQVGSALNLFHQ